MLHARSLQLRIALAFLGLIVGFVGAVLYVPLALWPVAQRAGSIQTHRAGAKATQGDAERIHGRIRRLASGYVILAAIGTAGHSSSSFRRSRCCGATRMPPSGA